MKKNLLARRLLVSTVACAAIMCSTAIAQEVTTDAEQPISISAERTDEAEVVEEAYTVYAGKVTSVTASEDGSIRVAIEGDRPIIANLQDGTYVINADEPNLDGMSISDIKEGMEVSFVIPTLSPMALSMPPQTSSVKVVVVGGEKSFYEISAFDESLVNVDSTLKLNINEDTKIFDVKGTRKVFTAEDVQNSQSIVFYTITTRSIPAQTTPSMILILDKDEEISADVETEDKTEITTKAEASTELVGLRDTATELGYTVDWTSNLEPITLSKDGSTIVVEIGTASYSINGEEKELTLSTELKEGKTFVSSVIFE